MAERLPSVTYVMEPRGYCSDCSFRIPGNSGKSVRRTAALVREHARKTGHYARIITTRAVAYNSPSQHPAAR